jgi:nitrate/nitrite transporter NarK
MHTGLAGKDVAFEVLYGRSLCSSNDWVRHHCCRCVACRRIAFFFAFVSTFAAAPLIPTIREALNLTKADVGNAASAAVVGAIAARILMGNFVDNYGPRYGIALTMGLTAPCVFCMSLVTNATGFIIVRMFIGFSLAVFVACQFWCTSLFNTKIVGTANAVAAGWVSSGRCLPRCILWVLVLLQVRCLRAGLPAPPQPCLLLSLCRATWVAVLRT